MSQRKAQKIKATQYIEQTNQLIKQYTENYYVPSEFYLSKYFPIMEKIQIPSIQELCLMLKKNAITWYNKKFMTPIFHKTCIKTNWQSFVYKVKFGNFEGQISILKLNFESNYYIPRIISKGQFGSISHFKFKKQQYALKIIKTPKQSFESLDNVIQQIFMLKIASSLKVGPDFANIFGYDAIIFSDSIHFVMQLCKTTYANQLLKQELETNNLLKNLKILHSLNICHKDIKYENIGYSKVFKKFVFLDFGFSKCLSEPIGYKSLTNYEGTFNYSSDQMKKIYFLRKKSYIDLYFNDLYCLKKTSQELEKSQFIKKRIFYCQEQFIIIQQAQNNNDQYFKNNEKNNYLLKKWQIQQKNQEEENKLHDGSYADFISFYLLKYNLFECKIQEVKQIIFKQNILLNTFRRILHQQIQQNKNSLIYHQICKIYKKFIEKCQKYQQNNNLIQKYDAILYDYLLRLPICKTVMNYQQNLFQIGDMQIKQKYIKFDQIWLNEKWKEQIFYFIDINLFNKSQRKLNDNKKKFVSFLYKYIHEKNKNSLCTSITQITKSKMKNYFIIYRQILLYFFFNEFLPLQNVILLQKIQNYFILYNDQYLRSLMEIQILKIYKKGPILIYIFKNLQYFLGKNMVSNSVDLIDDSDNIFNLEESLQFLYKGQINQVDSFINIELLTEYLKLIIQILKLIKMDASYYLKLQNKRKYDFIFNNFKDNSIYNHTYIPNIKNYIQIIGQIIKFKQQNVKKFPGTHKNKINFPNLSHIQSQYLKLQLSHHNQLVPNDIQNLHRENHRNYNVQLSTLQYFLPFLQFEEINSQNSQKIFRQCLFYYLKILRNHNFNITEIQLVLIDNYIKDQQIVTQFISNYFEQFQLQRIKTMRQLKAIFICLIRVLNIFCVNNYTYNKKRKKYKHLLNNLTLFIGKFIMIVFPLKIFCFQDSNTQESWHCISIKQFQTLSMNLLSLINIVTNNFNQASILLIKIPLYDDIENRTHFLCEIYQFLNKQNKQKVSKFLFTFYTYFQQNDEITGYYAQSTIFYKTLLKMMIQGGSRYQSFNIMLKYFKYVLITVPYSIDYKITPIIHTFIKDSFTTQLYPYLQMLLQQQYKKQFNKILPLYILLFDLFVCLDEHIILNLQDQNNIKEETIIKKLLVLCSHGFNKIQNNQLCLRKQVLKVKIAKHLKREGKISNSNILRYLSEKQFESYKNKYIKRMMKKYVPINAAKFISQKIFSIYQHNYYVVEKLHKQHI